ncbi:DUF998 domain-containing protein [Clostridium pasteurianum]|uniref:DUF998 domain-containing protein n=1 Tax=Clostridium pasteurianum BC1 TaxID=86416 RepID=R4JYT1_CLOPA|nr:DUF998 domain-containing protein [Clostridium pasteurianum]AGK95982.1 hypothetical protein Clopa_0967 [Clostridium pasteurianum BC1]
MKKIYSIFGMISPLFYLIHVIIGSMLWSGYNNITQPISDLTAADAPNREILSIFTNMYGICGLIFSIGSFNYLKKLKVKIINVSMIIFIAMVLIGVSYGFFPEDMAGATMTFEGFMHLVITALIVPTAILTPLFAGLGFRKLENFKKFSNYSIATSVIIFVSGGMSVIAIANKISIFGAIERINIGSLQLWIFIFALIMFTNHMDKITVRDNF